MDAEKAAPATRSSWTNHEMPSKRARLSFPRLFDPVEHEILKRGVVPQEMEDRWFVFSENGWTYFCRSWTGYCVFQIRLERDQRASIITEALANRDDSQYRWTSDEEDARVLGRLIDHIVSPERR